MKKITLLVAFMLAIFTGSYGQASSYGFLESTEAYTAVVGTSSTATGDDGSQNAIPIGFTFNYDGINYTDFSINTNGWIKMGTVAIAGGSWTNVLSNTAVHRPLIAPLWDDNNRNTGDIQYVVTGVSPNQILEVGWNDVNIGGGGTASATSLASFKLRLYETTNVIEFVYGPTLDTAGTLSASVGLNGASSFLSVTPAATSTVSSATANNGISATTDLLGKKYTFTPPSCGTPGGITASAVTIATATVSWTATVPAPVTGYEYVVSTTNTTPVGAGTPTTSVSVPVTGLVPSTAYYIFVRSNCGGTFSPWSSSVTFTTPCLSYTIPYFEGFETGYTQDTSISGCLIQESITGTQVWNANTSLTSFNRTPRTGLWNAYLGYGNEDWIFIPINLVGGTSYTASLFARQDYPTSADADMTISYGTAGNAASMTNTVAATTGIIDGGYQQIAGSFTPVSTGTYYVGIKGRMSFAPFYISLDDISIDVTPACSNPLGLAASAVTNVSATTTWTATTGNYEYVLDNAVANPAGSGTVLAGETYNATLLLPSTTYYFHVRSVCAGPTYSPWSTVSFTTLATPPVNDNCSGATILTPGADFSSNSIVGTNVGATASAGEVAPGCASYLGGDVWYSVTVPASGSLTFENNTEVGGITDTGGAVYSGSCGALVLIDCNDSASAAGNDHPLITVTGRTAGEVLYYRVWEYGNNAFGQFKVSAYDASLSTQSFDISGFSVYPNPVKDMLNLSYTKEISNVSVHNLLGQEVMTKSINATQTKIDMSNLSNGTYLVKVTVDGLAKTIKVIKQ